MQIKTDDLQGSEIQALLQSHLDDMADKSPPESIHALDLTQLRQPDITFWTAWQGEALMGCGAIKQLTAKHAEIKSMRTSPAHLRKGVAKTLLQHILAEADARGYERVSLETGSMDSFRPARELYRRHGFVECKPFADYTPDPNSTFMTLLLRQ